MIWKLLLFLALLSPGISLCAEEDSEILQDLEFFKALHLVKQVDDPVPEPQETIHSSLPISKKNEVKHETR